MFDFYIRDLANEIQVQHIFQEHCARQGSTIYAPRSEFQHDYILRMARLHRKNSLLLFRPNAFFLSVVFISGEELLARCSQGPDNQVQGSNSWLSEDSARRGGND